MDELQVMNTIGTGGGAATGGTTHTIGNTGTGGTVGTWGGTAPSCSGLAAICGPSGTDDCCKSLLVPGGTFYRSYDGVSFTDKSYPATVDDFYLDKYEITVGRFRAFVNAGMGTKDSPPAAGAGAHPGITGSGWDLTWNTNLAANTAELTAMLRTGSLTWTDTPGSNESMPVDCLDNWYMAFAFCAWDGGRLATEAEWNYAASGGSEQRYYPWSSPATSTKINHSYAVYDCGDSCGRATENDGPENVGSKSPKGDGKWGQSDLEGNVAEWTLDANAYRGPYPMPCNNCADLTEGFDRVIRGCSFGGDASQLRVGIRDFRYPGGYFYQTAWSSMSGSLGIGARCARNNL